MKKYILVPALALALGFAACDDDDTLGIPVTNPQLPIVDENIATMAPAAVAQDVIELEPYNNDEINVPLAEVTVGEEWPEGYGFGAVVELADNEEFNNAVTLEGFGSGNTISVNPDDLQGYIYDKITHAPVEQTLWVRFGLEAVKGAQTIRIGDADTWMCPTKIKVMPLPPTKVLEEEYYLVISPDGESWSTNDAVAFSKTSSKSVYDDGEYTVITTMSNADGAYWRIVPKSTFDSGNLNEGQMYQADPKSAESRKGTLSEAEDATPGYIDLGGAIQFKMDILKMTFEYLQAIPNFWLAGDNVNGLTWSFSVDPQMQTNDYVNYAGFAVLGKEFKFSPKAGWGSDFGNSEAFVYTTDKDGIMTGKGKADGGGNINVGAPGLWYIALNYQTREVNMTKLETVGIIGGFNEWKASLPMTASADQLTYTVTTEMNKGDEWKFRFNDAWAVSLGGDLDNLSPFNGANIVCKETGTYDITLDLHNVPWTATVVKK